MPTRSRHDPGLDIIAAFKMVKAVLLILAGVGAFSLLRPDTADAVREWLADFADSHGQQLVERAVSMLNGARPGQLKGVGLASIAYGLLFAVEGVGLWLEKRWAEYLTVIATGSLIPFEIYELVRRLTILRSLALLVNIAAVVYLIFRLRHPTSEQRMLPNASRKGK